MKNTPEKTTDEDCSRGEPTNSATILPASKNTRQHDCCNQSDAAVDKASEEVPKSQVRRPWYKKWWTWTVGAVVAALVCMGVVFVLWNANHTEMPDLLGMSPEQATQSIDDLSGKWSIEILDSYGNPYDEKYEALDFTVIASSPIPGTVLTKSDSNLTITLTVDLSAEALATVREATIQKEIQDSLDNGWASEEYYDGGSFIVLKAVSAYSSVEIETTSQEFVSTNQDLYKAMTETTRANIAATAYTADGFLYGVCLAPYSQTTEEDKALFAERVAEMLSQADKFASDHLDIVASLVLKERFSLWPGSEYSYNGDTLTFFIYSPHSDTYFTYAGDQGDFSAKVQQEAQEGYEAIVQGLAQILRCNVVMNFYNKGAHEPFATASCEKLPWL